MDAAGVDRAVIYPPMWDPDSNELAVEAVRTNPDRFAILGWFPLDRPESRSLVDRGKQRPGCSRFYFNQPQEQTWPDRRHARLAVAGGRARYALDE
jgi:predicted TIM-barrel fold metal-dependent hydrolase